MIGNLDAKMRVTVMRADAMAKNGVGSTELDMTVREIIENPKGIMPHNIGAAHLEATRALVMKIEAIEDVIDALCTQVDSMSALLKIIEKVSRESAK